MKTKTLAGIGFLLLTLLSFIACDRDRLSLFFNVAADKEALAVTENSGAGVQDLPYAGPYAYGERECDLTDPFYAGSCPTCTVKIIPRTLGLLIGDKEDARTFLIQGPRGTQFDNATVVKWDSDAIEVVSRHIFLKRFMLMRVKIKGADLDKGLYRVLLGQCEGTIKWAFNNTQHCLTSNCLDRIIECQSDTECTGWLGCMQECGDDQMLCPTVCGAFYQSPNVNAFIQCGLDNGCIKIDFSSLPPCNLPEDTPVPVANIDGFWWVAAIRGHDYVLYDDCQRFIFKELNATEISVENSTLVTYKGETKSVKNIGTYTRTSDGYLKLIYENWAGYYEQYYPFYVTPNVMIMQVCSADSSSISHDYGTFILTRVPLASLDSAEMAGVETTLKNIFQTTLGDFHLLRTSDCPNGPEAMQQRFTR